MREKSQLLKAERIVGEEELIFLYLWLFLKGKLCKTLQVCFIHFFPGCMGEHYINLQLHFACGQKSSCCLAKQD